MATSDPFDCSDLEDALQRIQQSSDDDFPADLSEFLTTGWQDSDGLQPAGRRPACYSMNREIHGVCLIINNHTFTRNKSDPRSCSLGPLKGYLADRENLRNTFERLGFKVLPFDNLSHKKMMAIVKKVAEYDHSNYDCFVCCILSHGHLGTVCGADGVPVEISDIAGMLRPAAERGSQISCPSLSGKPKLFFIQACQGENLLRAAASTAQADFRQVKLLPNGPDFLTAYATVSGSVSWVHQKEGSWFIKTLTELLDECAHRYHLNDILTMVNGQVGELRHPEGYIQAPEVRSSLKKNVFFRIHNTKKETRAKDKGAPVTRMSSPKDTVGNKGAKSRPRAPEQKRTGESVPVTEMPKSETTLGNTRVEPRPSDRVMAFDPLTATPRRTFCMDNSQLMIQGDKETPWIRSLVVTDGGKIVMTDRYNNKVKIMDSRTLTIVSSLSLGVGPWGLALLHDKLLAVTPSSDDVIHLIDVTVKRRLPEQVEKVELRVVRQIKTVRQYRGVGCGGENGTLVVSCEKQGKLPASVDILSREGQVLKTVVINEKLRGLCSPWYLCVVHGVALVSDNSGHCIYRVDLATGRVMSPITHDQLKSPYQVSADRSGNLYIASNGVGCVLVIRVDGRWRTLLRGEEHGKGRNVWPYSVTVTDTGVVVGWVGGSVVTGFDLT